MTTLQVYEFHVLQRPLNDSEQDEVAALLPNPPETLTSTTLRLESKHGTFEDDRIYLLTHYFDVCVCTTPNNGRRFATRLPEGILDIDDLAPYLVEGYLDLYEAPGLQIIEFTGRQTEPLTHHSDPTLNVRDLLGLPALLKRGDLRPVYLGFLNALLLADIPADVLMPPRPSALNQRPPSLDALTHFLDLDPLLIAVATAQDQGNDAEALRRWLLDNHRPEQLADALVETLSGQHQLVRELLLGRFLTSNARITLHDDARSVGEVLDTLEQQHAETSRFFSPYVDDALDVDAEWQAIDNLLEARQRSAYDDAVERIQQLRTWYADKGQQPHAVPFQARLDALVSEHRRKRLFIRALKAHQLV